MLGQPGAALWPSLNCGMRRGGATPDIVLIHYTAMPSALGARDWLCNPQSQVSAHYVVARSGQSWQLVCETRRAWHAGRGGWGDVEDVNSRSIGIEIANTGSEPFPEVQMRAVKTLVGGIMRRWSIPPHRVLGHSDVAPGRKIDPGRRFDWQGMARAGLAIGPLSDHDTEKPSGFWPLARQIGYVWQPGQDAAVLDAFRSRFAPQRFGPVTGQDAAEARSILQQVTAFS